MIITILSPKGGTGKSTTTANVAGYLADQGSEGHCQINSYLAKVSRIIKNQILNNQ